MAAFAGLATRSARRWRSSAPRRASGARVPAAIRRAATPPTAAPIDATPMTIAGRTRTCPYRCWRQTPTRTVGMIASSEVASAWSCVSPSQVSVGTKRMPPPTPNMPGEDAGGEAEHDREGVGHWRSIRIAIATRRPAKRNESVRTGSALLQDAAAGGAERRGHADEQRVRGLDLAVHDVRDDAGGGRDADRGERGRGRGAEIPAARRAAGAARSRCRRRRRRAR